MRPPKPHWDRPREGSSANRFPPRPADRAGRGPGKGRPESGTERRPRPWNDSSNRGPSRDREERGAPPARRRFEPPAFERNQGTEEPTPPPRPRGPNREPRPSESPEPTPPPRPTEPVTAPPGPPERGRLVKRPRRP
jgi:hypothetical protein